MKVLHMSSELDGGGVERLLLDYYTYMDHDKIHFDFVKVESPKEGILEKPLRDAGSRIFTVPRMRTEFGRYRRELGKILSDNHYDVIHCNGGYTSAEALRLAKRRGVPVRIAHSHLAYKPESALQRAVRLAATPLTKHYATDLFACGEDAAKWMWGQRTFASGRVTIMRNAIRTEDFAFDQGKRERLRAEFGLSDRYVLGCVGRLTYQKNHEFLLNTFAEVIGRRPDAVLLLIGRGDLEEEIRRQAERLNLTDSVRMLGVRNDVPDLLNMMDLFVLPSRYEGLPVSVVEAQANGIPSLIADTVTQEISINPNVAYLPLRTETWAEAIVNGGFVREEHGTEQVTAAGYDIRTEAAKMERKYMEMVGRI